MSALAAEVVTTPTEVNSDPGLTSSYLGAYNFQNQEPFDLELPLPTPQETKPEATPALAAETPVAPKEPEAPAPPAPEGKKSRPEAEMRIKLKQLETEREQWQKEREELLALRDSKIPELETNLATHKTTAESYQKDLEHFKSTWKNEREKEWQDIAAELPEWQEAQKKAEGAWTGLFPRNIANPSAGEAEIRFNPANMTPETTQAVNRMVAQWAEWEFNPKVSDAQRADVQHIIVSNIAKRLGVPDVHMEQKEVGGTTYDVIRPDHPVYNHLIGKIPDVVNTRIDAAQIQQRAQQESKAMATEAIRRRQENRREFYKTSGFGASPDELRARAAREPNNPVIQALNLIGDDDELKTELQAALEQEAVTDGYWKPHFTGLDEDPKAYDQAARAHMARISSRPVMASIGQVLLKQTAKQRAEIAQLTAKVKELQEENDRNVRQGEPSLGSGGSESDDTSRIASSNPYLAGYSFRG